MVGISAPFLAQEFKNEVPGRLLGVGDRSFKRLIHKISDIQRKKLFKPVKFIY